MKCIDAPLKQNNEKSKRKRKPYCPKCQPTQQKRIDNQLNVSPITPPEDFSQVVFSYPDNNVEVLTQ